MRGGLAAGGRGAGARALAMTDFNPPAYRGDPGINHTGDNAFITWMGGCWGFVAIDKIRHVIEPRPMFNPAVMLAAAEERQYARTGRSSKYEAMQKDGSYKAREERANKAALVEDWGQS